MTVFLVRVSHVWSQGIVDLGNFWILWRLICLQLHSSWWNSAPQDWRTPQTVGLRSLFPCLTALNWRPVSGLHTWLLPSQKQRGRIESSSGLGCPELLYHCIPLALSKRKSPAFKGSGVQTLPTWIIQGAPSRLRSVTQIYNVICRVA